MNFKKLLPHVISVAIFLIITFIFFMPLFQGKIIAQHDIKMWEGMSKEILDFRAKYHSEPLWTSSMFSGMPAYQVSVLYPANLLAYVNNIITLGLTPPAAYIFLALLSFYLLLIVLKVDWRFSIAGAISYALVSYNFIVITAGHNSKAHAIALMPLVLAGILLVFQKKYLLGGALTALALGLEVYANHLQITYYLMLTILILVVAETVAIIKEKDFKHLLMSAGVLIVAVVLAVLPNTTSLMATSEYGEYSTRGASELTSKKISTGLDKDYATTWSYGKWETSTLLVPNAVGGASQIKLDENSKLYEAFSQNGLLSNPQAMAMLDGAPVYWGAQDMGTSGPVYVGAIAVFLFVLGFFLLEKKYKWWLVTATVLSITLSWGKNFQWLTDIFFDHFPAYNKFRAVSMLLVIASFTIPLMAFMSIQKLNDANIKQADKTKALLYSLYITAGLCVFVLLGGASQGYVGFVDKQMEGSNWMLEAIRGDRARLLRNDVFRSLFFVGSTFAVLWFYLKGKLKPMIVYPAIAILVLVDSGMVASHYLNSDNYTEKPADGSSFVPTDADKQIMADKELGFRVMNTTVSTFNDASTSYFHRSIGGYHGAKLKRYQELVENQMSTGNQKVLNMLNTKYFIIQDQKTGQLYAQQNPEANGPAWFVSNYIIVANADSEMNALTNLDNKTTVVVDKRFENELANFKPSPDSTASISVTKYESNNVVYKTNTASEQFAVFSEVYYDKGWNAYIDGKQTPYVRCNYVLRGMKVPAGTHTIEFKFEPEVYAKGETISMIGSIILLLLFAGAVVVSVISMKKEQPVVANAVKK